MGRTPAPEEWHRRYDNTIAYRRLVEPAYLDAFAPLVAGAIDFHTNHGHTGPVTILTIGGGDGHFSKEVLPEVRRHLQSLGNKTRLLVTETDEARVIKNAGRTRVPGTSTSRVLADMHTLPFKINHFDIVVAESSLYVNGRRGMGPAISEIKRVLAPGGMLLHIQDGWSPAWVNTGAGQAENTRENRAASSYNIAKGVVAHAVRRGLSARYDEIVGLTKVPYIPGANPEAIRAGANTAMYNLGTFRACVDDRLAPGEYQLGFVGVAAIAAKGVRAGDVFKHAYARFMRER